MLYIFLIFILIIAQIGLLLAEYIEFYRPIERIRRNRLLRLTSRKMLLENKIYSLQTNKYQKVKGKMKSVKKIKKMLDTLITINADIEYLNKYGEKDIEIKTSEN